MGTYSDGNPHSAMGIPVALWGRDNPHSATGIPIALWGHVQSLTHSATGTIALWELRFLSPNHIGGEMGIPIALWESP